MKTALKLFRVSRKNILNLVNDLSLNQVNTIPEGHNNNIAWQLGHLISSHKGLIYSIGGIENDLDTAFIQKYKKGSKPENPIEQAEFDFMKMQIMLQVNDLEKDVAAAIFKDYTPYKTSYNFEITNNEEAVQFNNTHQALHLTSIAALKRKLI